MNIPRDPDTVLAAWLEDGPIRLPHETRQAIAVGIRTVPRRRPGLGLTLGGARLGLPDIGLRRVSMALGGAAVVVLASALALGVYDDRPAVGGPVPAADPRDPFLGTWVSTSDADGGTQTMTVRTSADGAVEIVVTDDVASVCSGALSTMTGTGRIEGSTRLVIPFPSYACDDGSEPETQSGPPLEEQLRNLTFVRDAQAENLTDNFGGVWLREVAATPSPEPTTPPSEAEVTALLNGLLEARVAGEGAQQYLHSLYPDILWEDIPLLYATSSGAPYERAEFEPVPGTEWPYGFMAFKVRLFAGDTVVEQLFFMPHDDPQWFPADGRLGLEYQPDGFGTHIAPTTENGQPVAVPYSFSGGEVTLQPAHPWVFHDGVRVIYLIPEGPGVRPTTDGGERTDWDQLVLMADPWLGVAGCQTGPDPADAQALAECIRSNPDLGATAPVPVSVGGAEALMMDVVIAAGATISGTVNEQGDFCADGVLSPVFDECGSVTVDGNGVATGIATGDWMRLYLFDVAEGSSMRTLAIAIVAPESSFERVVEAAVPVVNSVEFHAP